MEDAKSADGIKTAINNLFTLSSQQNGSSSSKDQKSTNVKKEESSDILASTASTIPPAGSRVNSSAWAIEYKKDYDNTPVDPTIFSEGLAEGEKVPATSTIGSRTETTDTLLRRLENQPLSSSQDKKQQPQNNNQPTSSIGNISQLLAVAEADSKMGQGRVNSYDMVKDLLNDPSVKDASSIPKVDQRSTGGGAYDQVAALVGNTNIEGATSAAVTGNGKQKKSPGRKKAKDDVQREYVDEKDIKEDDVICGRGGKSNHHRGNKRYRQVVSEMKTEYRGKDAKSDKTDLSREIVERVLAYGGRFVKKDSSKRWFLLTKNEARKKTSQALRETKILKWTLEEEDKNKVLRGLKKPEIEIAMKVEPTTDLPVQTVQKTELQAINATEV